MHTPVSFLLQLYYFLNYSMRKPKMQLEHGMLIISVDVDVGSRELGVINKGRNDENISTQMTECRVGEIEETAFPLFLEVFDHFQVPATFAVRGQLTEVNDSILKALQKSSTKHDIGAHGYYHRRFTNLSSDEANNELKMISIGMKKFGITPRSFVFPKNNVAHLSLLEKYRYACYRSHGDFRSNCMYIEKKRKLYDIHPSLYITDSIGFGFLRKILDVAIAKSLPFHIWFHLWNFGETKESMQRAIDRMLFRLFKYGKKKEKIGNLSFETMFSAAEKVEMSLAGS